MRSQKYSSLLALATVVLLTMACSTAEPTLSNVRTARDQDGARLSAVFGKSDTVYVVGDLSNGVKGNKVSSKWYAENVQGIEPDFLLDSEEIQVPESGPYTLHFDFPAPAEGWPTGTYKVEVYFNDALLSTVSFSIQ